MARRRFDAIFERLALIRFIGALQFRVAQTAANELARRPD
jgi:hypothetical protein